MILEISYSKQAAKFLAKQEKSVQNRIIKAIESLPAGDVKKMVGRSYYRLRVGNFRVLFNQEGIVIYINKIENRGQVYK